MGILCSCPMLYCWVRAEWELENRSSDSQANILYLTHSRTFPKNAFELQIQKRFTKKFYAFRLLDLGFSEDTKYKWLILESGQTFTQTQIPTFIRVYKTWSLWLQRLNLPVSLWFKGYIVCVYIIYNIYIIYITYYHIYYHIYHIIYHIYYVIYIYFLLSANFRFIKKLENLGRQYLYTLHPASPNVNDLHTHGTMSKTSKWTSMYVCVYVCVAHIFSVHPLMDTQAASMSWLL